MKRRKGLKRILAALMATALIVTGLPEMDLTASASTGAAAVTVADPSTLTRPLEIYDDDTQNAGKITVGKSVSNEAVKITSESNEFTFTPEEDNFIVTYSQTAQVMGLSTEIPVPVDAVFVLDTSGSMAGERTKNMVTAANKAIKTLLDANEYSRVAVVAFSSADGDRQNEQYGGGTSEGAAANVLSSLAHYDTTTDHLTWVNSSGTASNNGSYIAGRDSHRTVNAYRHGSNGGTNIQAGIALGAQQLMNATDLVVNVNGKALTRIPFLIVLSDGQPTFSANEENWYNLNVTSAAEQGPGNSAYEGNGFLAALTAAYYKGAITDKYYGANASEENRAFVYTIGLNISSINNGDERELAKLTLDPKTYSIGNYASGERFEVNNRNTYSYYYYGNSFNDDRLETNNSFRTYWNNYSAATANNFDIRVNNNDTYTVTKETIAATTNYVNGYRTVNGEAVSMGYTGGLIYNDDHFSADGDGSAELEAAFDQLVRTIQLKAIAAPTLVTGLADFDGYVHYYDPIGEYMEVKAVHGVVHDGYNFQGKSFAQKLQNFNTANADPVFDQAVRTAMKGRQALTDAQINELVAAAVESSNQAWYDPNTGEFDNSLVWWGKSYTVSAQALDEEVDDAHVKIQYLAPADNDTVEYIEANKDEAAHLGADYICRSYYYYGTAGGAIAPTEDALLFVVRVQRSLTAPYNETVVISIPASLLCIEKVLITERNSGSTPTYVATVQEDSAVRLIYEVGLRSDINAQNVESIVDSNYASEVTAHAEGMTVGRNNVEVDPATGDKTYYFYTNDWDRTQTESSHLRAMTKVSYHSAPDNEFYKYQADTPILDANGNSVTGSLPNDIYYYARTVYKWKGASLNTDGTYNATKETVMIPIRVDSSTGGVAKNADGTWYIEAGTYTSETLLTTGDDVVKAANNTETAQVVTHPMRTNDHLDSHYTVYLGNNGRLALTADETKSVSLNHEGTVITDADGKLVTVGDELTYTIKVVNNEGAAANAVVTDQIPAGTELIEGSISFDANGTGATSVNAVSGKTITWNIKDIPVNGTVYAAFKVKVTEAALAGASKNIENIAAIQIGNNPTYDTNKTENPPVGKIVAGESVDIGTDGQNGIEIGQTLIYHIYWTNTDDGVSDVTVTDIIPQGTVYLPESASHNGIYTAETTTESAKLTWTFEDVQPGVGGVVTFKVVVDASAKSPITNGAEIQIGENSPVVETNTTSVDVLTGDLKLTKVVENGGKGYENKVFTLQLATSGSQMGSGYGLLNGTYNVSSTLTDNSAQAATVTFEDGKATVSIKAGETLTIQDLPAGLQLTIKEDTTNTPGYTATYSPTNGTVQVKSGTTVAQMTVTNTYSADAIKFQLLGTKKLTTDDYIEARSFVVEVETCDANWIPKGEIATTAQGSVSSTTTSDILEFAVRTFTLKDVGEYYYLITETEGSLEGVTYDKTQYRMKLSVADTGDGKLILTPEIWKKTVTDADFVAVELTNKVATTQDGIIQIKEDVVVFNNEYQPITATLKLEAYKTLMNKDMSAGEFGFEIFEVVNGVESANAVDTALNVAGKAGEAVKFVFGGINFTRAGKYIYNVKEIAGNNSLITYDESYYQVEIEVKDESGRLVAVVKEVTKYTKDASGTYVGNNVATKYIHFENEYIPAETVVSLTGSKELSNQSGKDRNLKAGEFTFEVREDDADGTDGTVVSTGYNDQNGNIVFEPIKIAYDSAKTYPYTLTYEIVEKYTGDPYMDYADPVTIQINVAYDKATGLLTAALVTSLENIKFTNTQYPDSIAVTLNADKITTVSGNDAISLGGVNFGFEVLDQNGKEVTSGVAPAGASGEAKSVTFYPLTFTTAGTYEYTIRERNAGNTLHGITYDGSQYKAIVTVKNTDGKLEAATTYKTVSGNDLIPVNKPVFNNIYDAEGSLNITATKKFVDSNNNPLVMKAGEFQFEILQGDTVVSRGSNDAEGKVVFETIYYSLDDITDEAGTVITYQVKEIVPNPKRAGVTYDSDVDTLRVTLKVDGGKIEPTIEYESDADLEFTNTYQAVTGASATIQAKKELIGRDEKTLTAGEFSFGLFEVTSAGEIPVAVAQNAADGTITFTVNYEPAEMVFTPDSTTNSSVGSVTRGYKYVIREYAGSAGGITYDTETEYWVGVSVTDDRNGILTASNPKYYEDSDLGTEAEEVVFKNIYKAAPVDFAPVVAKELKNRPLGDNEFSFVVKNKDDKEVSVGLSKNDGSIAFTKITVDAAGNYDYAITELPSQIAGVSHDSKTIYMKVIVKDDQQGSLYVESIAYYADADYTQSIEAKFTNIYTPKDDYVELQAKKSLVGRTMLDYEFDFAVYNYDVVNKQIQGESAVAYGDNIGGNVKFSAIGYKHTDMDGSESKDFWYIMSEIEPIHLGGITIGEEQYIVKVTVTDDKNGALHANPYYYKYDENNELISIKESDVIFTNKYDPEDVKVDLSGKKLLIGKLLETGEFTFELQDKSGNIITMSSEGREVIYIAQNDASGIFRFPTLTLDTAGVYEYYLKEKPAVNQSVITEAAMQDNYIYDGSIYKIKITVTDDQAGKLHAVTEYYKLIGNDWVDVQNITFANTYTPDEIPIEPGPNPENYSSASAKINATKAVIDKAGVAVGYPMNGAFKFEVRDINGVSIGTGTSTENGAIEFDFGSFTFKTAGEYYYRIGEVASGEGGITEDTRQWELHVHVKNNANKISVEDVYGVEVPMGHLYIAEMETFAVTAAGNTKEAPAFVNTYDPAPVRLTITADKKLTGRALQAREFTFQLMEGDLVVAEAYNAADGTITFDINVDTAGTHTYTIKEVIPVNAAGGVTYEEDAGNVTVTVTDDYSGRLKVNGAAEITVDSDVTFENSYKAAETSAVITAKKTLSGRTLADKEFGFRLVDKSTNAVVEEVYNDANGDIVFEVPYDKAGTYEYILSEVIGNDSNINYDKSLYAVTVKVVDDLKGQLHAQVSYDIGHAPVFTNIYTEPMPPTPPAGPKAAVIDINGTKIFKGGKLEDGQFKFEVHLDDGSLIGHTTNKADGSILFQYVAFSKEGNYHLNITEVNEGKDGIEYDTTVYEMLVTVTKENGELKATAYYPDGGIVFTNMVEGYNAPPTGDDSPLGLYAGMLLIACAGLAGLLLWRKKHEENE